MDSIGKIGLIMPEVTDPLDYELLAGICSQAFLIGYDIVVYTGIFNSQAEFQQDYYTDGLENIYSLICKSDLNGIIFAAERFRNEQLINKIFSYLSQTNIPSLTLGAKRDGFAYINAEQHDGAYAMTKHLIDIHGCRKLYCIAGLPDHEPSQERLQGFIDAMSDSGLEINENSIHYGWYWKDIPERLARDIAAGKLECPDGVVCLSDAMAIAFGDELTKNGINVPEKVKVTGYDGMWHSVMHDPMITTVSGRDMQLGETAVRLLYEMMTGEKCSCIGCEQFIRYGTSCGCGYDQLNAPKGVLYTLEKHVVTQLLRSFDKKTFIATDYISRLANSTSLDELMNGVDNVGHIIQGWKWLDIALCEDWQSDFDNPYSFRQHSFSDRMYLALSKRYGENEKSGYYYPTANILPALDKSHEPMIIVLTSLHCKGQIFGYSAMAFDSPDDIELDEYFVNWCDAVSSGLHSLQKRLYINYIHQQMESFSTKDAVTGMLNKRGFTEQLPDTLHKLRKAGQGYSLLLISWLNDTAAYDAAVIISNALKKKAADKLCGRLGDNIFSVLMTSENDTELFITELKNELTASLGNPVLLPEMFTGAYEISGKLPAEIERSVDDNCSRFSEKRSSELCRNFTYREQIYSLRREIMTQPQLDWNIPDISRELGISKTHLQRLYKELFSTSIKDDIILSRMNRAMQLLARTDLRVQEIAEHCGYKNENHFMRQFKEKNGMTALQYRKNNK